jgi:competence protein ComEC
MKHWPLHKAYFWETAPFFRILLPFVAGIFFYERAWLAGISAWYFFSIISVSFLLFTTLVYAKKNNGAYRAVAFLLLNVIMFFIGVSFSYLCDIRNDKNWFGNKINNASSYLVRITDIPSEKEHSWKLPVAVISAIENGSSVAVKGNAFLYVYKGLLPMTLRKGDSILIPGKWQPIKNAGNPFEFDYAGYCRQNNMLYQQTCSINDLRLYGTSGPEGTSFIDRSHDWCMAQLDKYIAEPKTKGLIQAMLLGDEVNLDEDLRQSYSETGIVHIIAISGGNVAIFFLVISFLLWWMKDKKHLWIKYAIALPLVWFYVLMAGAPPSAIRAAVMFSLLAFSVMLQKNNNSLNTLFATAFLLLCAQPMWLFSVGFQLSFVAVLSLILFYAPVYKWLSPVNKVARLLWSTVAASVSAEVLVAPLVVYYFHTFPLLFIVANVLAYLFMGLVIISGIAIIVLSFIPLVAKGIGIFTIGLVTLFDKIVTWLQSCNPVSFHFLLITGIELVLIYITIAGIILFLLKKQKPGLFTGLVACCFLFASFCKGEWTRLYQHRLIVYNTGKANHIELIKGSTYAVLNTDTSAQKKIDYAVKPAHINWQAWKRDSTATNEVYEINGKTVLILNEEINADSQFPVDYLIINYTGNPDAVRLQKIFSPSVIVIGNNYTKTQQEKFVNAGLSTGITIHAVADKGAFILN